jgi:hypothetical protein
MKPEVIHPYERRVGLFDRVLEMLGPLAEKGALRGWVAEVVESARVRAVMRLPGALCERLDRAERARAEAALARIVSSAGERERLVADADLYVAHVLAEHIAGGADAFPFLCSVGPAGGDGVFRLARRDVEALEREAPDLWKSFERVLRAWTSAEVEVRREAVGALVECTAEVGTLGARRGRPTPAEEERLERLAKVLVGREPAAATDGDVAVSLCRAYIRGLRRRGEVVGAEGEQEAKVDA